MRSRLVWFVVGTTAGVYTTFKARRLAYRLTPSGVADQVGALGVGVRAFTDEVRSGMAQREEQLAADLGLTAQDVPPELEQKDGS